MTSGGHTNTEAWNLQLQAEISALHARVKVLEGALERIAMGDFVDGSQAYEYKKISRTALAAEDKE